MTDEKYWAVTCKVCGHHHIGPLVNTKGPTADVRFDGPFPCLSRAEETAYYESREWFQMTEMTEGVSPAVHLELLCRIC
jgi:hypothetical protein